tara:strand:- start:391 stop:567 length:177 start_codon:yes stop_codon:yes gene_type:complete
MSEKKFVKLIGRNGKEAIGVWVGDSIKVKNEEGAWTPITWKDFGGEAEIIHNLDKETA